MYQMFRNHFCSKDLILAAYGIIFFQFRRSPLLNDSEGTISCHNPKWYKFMIIKNKSYASVETHTMSRAQEIINSNI